MSFFPRMETSPRTTQQKHQRTSNKWASLLSSISVSRALERGVSLVTSEWLKSSERVCC